MALYSKIKVCIKNIKRLLTGSKGIFARSTRGFIWLSAGSGFENGLRLIRNMILTRVLMPEVFGIMAIVFAINAAFQSFTEIGIKQAIIQNQKGDQQTYLNSAWWLSCIRGILLYVLAYICAPFIVNFYNNQELLPLIRIAFLVIIFIALVSPQAYVSIKKMDYKRWMIISNFGGAVGIITTVFLALYLRNVWALVLGFVSEAMVRLLFSHLLCPFVPGLTLEREHIKALLKYARRMLGLPILTFIFMKTDIFVIGKFLTTKELGLYSMAVALAQIPIYLSTILAEVLMPAFSEMQNRFDRINSSIFNITTILVLTGTPLLIFIMLCGEELLSFVYGVQYAAVAVPLTIIFATAFIRVNGLPIVTFYFAIGRPDLQRLFVGIRAIIIVLIIVPSVKSFGLIGGATAGLISMILGYILQIMKIRSLTNLNFRKYSMIFFQAFVASMIGIGGWYIIVRIFENIDAINLIAGFIGSLMAFFTLAILLYSMSKPTIQSLKTSLIKQN